MGWGGGQGEGEGEVVRGRGGEGEGERSTVTWGATDLNGTAANRIWVIQ